MAFSGGVDSTYLLAEALRVLGPESCLAVTAISDSMAPEEFDEAQELAESLGARWITINTHEIDDPAYRANDRNRCYHCKHELFGTLTEMARKEGLGAVLDGSNADDVGDWRPGTRAARELEVLSPLMDAGLTKDEIRALSHERGLSTATKPAQACLASRLPYGTEVTAERLRQVAAAETTLRSEGFDVFRARYHDGVARIELGETELERIADQQVRQRVFAGMSACGFASVCVDLRGFKSGNMNRRKDGESLQIEPAWSGVLNSLGLDMVRVRRVGDVTILAAPEDQIDALLESGKREEIVSAFESRGAMHIALDLAPVESTD